MTVPTLYTIEQVAALTHAPPSSVRSWVYSGRLGSVKAGRKRLVPEPDLRRFLGFDGAPNVQRDREAAR